VVDVRAQAPTQVLKRVPWMALLALTD